VVETGEEDVGDEKLGARNKAGRAALGIAGQQRQHAGSVQIVARRALLRADHAVADASGIMVQGRVRAVDAGVDDADFQVAGADAEIALPADDRRAIATIRRAAARWPRRFLGDP